MVAPYDVPPEDSQPAAKGTPMATERAGSVTPGTQWFEQLRSRVNLKQADAESRKPVQLIVAGPRRGEFLDALQSGGSLREDAILASETLPSAQAASAWAVPAVVYCPHAGAANGTLCDVAVSPYAIFVVRTGEAEGTAEARLATAPPNKKPVRGSAAVYFLSAISLAEMRKYLLPDIAQAYRGNEIALAAAIPAFRPVVAAKLTLDCAMTSLQIAAASAIADHIPVLGLITGGIASAGDTIAITALQMRMLLRIAAAYGKKADFARLLELVPVVGGGYGWRALAREASGFIPVAGIPIKAAIAYAGTLVVGQAASYYYETGSHLSPNAIGAIYREAADRAKGLLQHFAALPQHKRRQ